MAKPEGSRFFVHQKNADPIQAGIIFQRPESHLKKFLPVSHRKDIGAGVLEAFQLIDFLSKLDVLLLELNIEIVDAILPRSWFSLSLILFCSSSRFVSWSCI